MKDKEKMIEEMAEIISETWLVDLEGNTYDVCEFLDTVDIESIARELYEQGYRNCKDKVVLTREEINDIKVNHFDYGAEQGYEKGYLLGSKETAKEILDKVSRHYGGAWLVELYKEYGVEVE